MNFTICASGHLGFVVLKELVQHQVSVSFVLTDSHSDSILAYCEAQHIPCFKGNPRKGKFLEWMKAEGQYIQHLLSINYLFILDGEILNQVEGYAINFHGSLLPKYRGRTPHVWAIINGEKECGITAHLMNDRCDDGDIVKQLVLPIEEEDTGAKILEKYNAMYPSLVMEVVRMVQSGQVTCTPQDSSKATYFSKRTPADGEINWNWQKERIRNWVRAQAAPYPGAFTFYKGHKVTVHQVKAVDEGFMDTMPNGLILSLKEGRPIVKTPNGALLLTEYLCDIQFDEKELFSRESVDILIDKINSGGVKYVDYLHCNLHQLTEILALRNLPEIREWMVDNREILFDQHVAFVQSLARQSRVHYYAVYKGEQLCASLNIKETAVGICERGVFASPLIQGSGLSARIEAQFYSMLKGRGYKAVTAKVKHENARSIRYHEKLGYKETNRDNEFIYYQLDL